jgi:hypothetical protein
LIKNTPDGNEEISAVCSNAEHSGIEKAHADELAFIDAHVELCPEYLSKVLPLPLQLDNTTIFAVPVTRFSPKHFLYKRKQRISPGVSTTRRKRREALITSPMETFLSLWI